MSVNFDHNRSDLTGIPEVILAEPKTPKDFILTVLAGIERNNQILITRMEKEHVDVLNELIDGNFASDFEIQENIKSLKLIYDDYKRTAILYRNSDQLSPESLNQYSDVEPQVAILAAGTSDLPIVREIEMTFNFLGIPYFTEVDIGVAGINRHKVSIKKISEFNSIRIFIVVAGNEGALFSVVSSQIKYPIIAVPTGIGYGFGGKGETALRSALQSCSPGIAVVNIDNGFGAAIFVAKMINFGN